MSWQRRKNPKQILMYYDARLYSAGHETGRRTGGNDKLRKGEMWERRLGGGGATFGWVPAEEGRGKGVVSFV